jgi:hypothetical protein
MCDQLVAVLNLCDIFSNIFLGVYELGDISWGMISTSSPLSAMSFLVRLVYFVCPVCLVYLVHLVSVVQPKNQTSERDQLNPTTYSLCFQKQRVVTMSKGNTKTEQDGQHDLN